MTEHTLPHNPVPVYTPPARTLAEAKASAKRAADHVLEAWWDSDKFPVDPFKIAANMGVDVYTAQLPGDTSGLLQKLPNQRPQIYVDVDDSPRRRRFTASHELGHYAQRLLEDPRTIRDASLAFLDERADLASRGDDLREVFANNFAANLLMPASAVRMLRDAGMSVGQLAEFFDVSSISMEYRLKNLGLPL